MQKTAHMATNVKTQDAVGAGGGSLFDVRAHPRELGKSYISLACAPSCLDDELDAYTHQHQDEYENTYRMEPPKRLVRNIEENQIKTGTYFARDVSLQEIS